MTPSERSLETIGRPRNDVIPRRERSSWNGESSGPLMSSGRLCWKTCSARLFPGDRYSRRKPGRPYPSSTITRRPPRPSAASRTVHPSAESSRVVDLETYPRMSFTSNEEMIARPISLSVISSDTRFLASW